MKFEGKEDHSFVTFLDNPAICDTYPMRDQIMEKVQAEIFFNNECLTSCTGGKVDKKYLSKFPEYCSTIGGDLIIVERDVLEEIPVQAAPSRRVLFEAAEGSPPSTPPVAVFPTFLLKLFDYVCFRWFSYLRTPLAFDLARNQVVEQLSIHLIKTLVGRIGILRKSTRIILID
ncbi:hypothetical protein Y032_0180g794 [Ancylostoma ceylanicum]|uniref:Uncharacterized protein n=1 Tax=Ancylostoma ceylanicum TaxID=53326 RepID=A0A016STD4_9BILA|nr:hypothetical protein Y032_0180g794 [Ancylostoma ceylanicum]